MGQGAKATYENQLQEMGWVKGTGRATAPKINQEADECDTREGRRDHGWKT